MPHEGVYGYTSLSDLESPTFLNLKYTPLVLDKDRPLDIVVPFLVKYFFYFNLKKQNHRGMTNLGYDNHEKP